MFELPPWCSNDPISAGNGREKVPDTWKIIELYEKKRRRQNLNEKNQNEHPCHPTIFMASDLEPF